MATATGNASSTAETRVTDTVENAGTAINEAVETVTRKGRETARDAEDAVNNLDEAVRDFVREKPYTALAIAGFAGFLYAAIRRS